MNKRTSKLIHNFALVSGALHAVKRNARSIRRKWYLTPWNKRAALRHDMECEL